MQRVGNGRRNGILGMIHIGGGSGKIRGRKNKEFVVLLQEPGIVLVEVSILSVNRKEKHG